MDLAKNFAKGTLSTGYSDVATSIVLASGQGARFPAAPFNAVWWNSTDYPDPADDPDVEIIRVTVKATDTLTVTRAQEGTAASEKQLAGKTYQLIAPLTARIVNDELVSVTDDVYDLGTDRASAGFYADLVSNLSVLGDRLGAGSGTKVEVDDGNGKVTITNQPIMPNLPTTNPAVAGALWNDAGTVKVSAG